MSVAPAEPVVPGAPTEPPAAAATPPAAPVPTEPPKAVEPPPTNPWADPKAAEAEIERLRKENAKDRTNAKAQAAEEARNELAQSINKILNPGSTEPIDPAKLTESLTTSQAETKQARVELAVFRNAIAAGGDPAALLDSTSFRASLDSIDPTDNAAVTAAITAAVEANKRLGAASSDPRPPAPNPAMGAGANGAPDASALIAAARASGDWQTVIALENQKLVRPQ